MKVHTQCVSRYGIIREITKLSTSFFTRKYYRKESPSMRLPSCESSLCAPAAGPPLAALAAVAAAVATRAADIVSVELEKSSQIEELHSFLSFLSFPRLYISEHDIAMKVHESSYAMNAGAAFMVKVQT